MPEVVGDSKESVFQTKQCCVTYELTQSAAECTRPVQIQTRQSPSSERGKQT